MTTTNKGKGFFAVELNQFYQAADLGMAEACLYLIYCCGSGKSNDTTSWSVNALTTYTKISTRKGKAASLTLLNAKLTKLLKGGKHPRIQILKDDSEQVWLPNTFITGTGDEIAPIERLRRIGDTGALRLLLALYAKCNIADDGGVQADIIFAPYERKKIGTYKHFNFFGFTEKGLTASPELLEVLTESEKIDTQKGVESDTFWTCFKSLVHANLLDEVPTLFDSDEGEPLVALKDPFTLQYNDDLNMLNNKLSMDYQHYDYCLPVPKSYPNAELKGIYVPRYRQHTKLVAAGCAENQRRYDEYVSILTKAYKSDTYQQVS